MITVNSDFAAYLLGLAVGAGALLIARWVTPKVMVAVATYRRAER